MKRSVSLLTLLFSSACATYQGSAVDVRMHDVTAEPGWIRVSDVEVIKQKDKRDCGAAALASVLKYWGGRGVHEELIAEYLEKDGGDRRIRAGDLRDEARDQGLNAFLIQGEMKDLRVQLEKGRPVLVGVVKPYSLDRGLQHYEVVIGYHPEKKQVLAIDPAHGVRQNSEEGFLAEWQAAERLMLVIFPKEEKTAAR